MNIGRKHNRLLAKVGGTRANARRPRGSATLECILLFTLVLIGALAGYAFLNHAVIRQQNAVGTSVEGMNFPVDSSAATLALPAGSH